MENTYLYEVFENVIKRIDEDGNESWIPTDPANSDYVQFLEQQKTVTGK